MEINRQKNIPTQKYTTLCRITSCYAYVAKFLHMKKLFLILLLLPSTFSVAQEVSGNEDMSFFTDMMIGAKFTGICGVYSQMLIFQESTKMIGGDEFIVRFITTEAARLGHTLDSYTAKCSGVVEKYNNDMKLLGFEK